MDFGFELGNVQCRQKVSLGDALTSIEAEPAEAATDFERQYVDLARLEHAGIAAHGASLDIRDRLRDQTADRQVLFFMPDVRKAACNKNA
ncbi:MAG: hypothetical protein AAFR79_16225 [Pseudomonadota bacterium]